MTRHAGPILVLLVLLGMFAARWDVGRRADHLLVGEARARMTVSSLFEVCRHELATNGRLPSLHGNPASHGLQLNELPALGNEALVYASDDVYTYGLASNPHRDLASGLLLPGFVLRAWPTRFGVTGDLEYQIGDDGQLWEGQNRAGRSGTTSGFPPPFPEPGLGLRGVAWWPIDREPQR